MYDNNGLHNHPGMSDAGRPYLSIVAVLVESYALDSAWSLATAISFASSSPSFYLFITNDSIIKVCNSASLMGILHTHLMSRSSPTSLLFIGLRKGEGG